MRRFNQSMLLSKAISYTSGVPIAETALKRVKATVQQIGLSKTERAQCSGCLPRAAGGQGRGQGTPAHLGR